ncbi:hypothetical protein J6590_012747 [Homalodisca vitripennis]|nr:hypothetical protein J6590_012747 [Homalodisca vitripennis]
MIVTAMHYNQKSLNKVSGSIITGLCKSSIRELKAQKQSGSVEPVHGVSGSDTLLEKRPGEASRTTAAMTTGGSWHHIPDGYRAQCVSALNRQPCYRPRWLEPRGSIFSKVLSLYRLPKKSIVASVLAKEPIDRPLGACWAPRSVQQLLPYLSAAGAAHHACKFWSCISVRFGLENFYEEDNANTWNQEITKDESQQDYNMYFYQVKTILMKVPDPNMVELKPQNIDETAGRGGRGANESDEESMFTY